MFGNSKRGGEPGPDKPRDGYDRKMAQINAENPDYQVSGTNAVPGPGTY